MDYVYFTLIPAIHVGLMVCVVICVLLAINNIVFYVLDSLDATPEKKLAVRAETIRDILKFSYIAGALTAASFLIPSLEQMKLIIGVK